MLTSVEQSAGAVQRLLTVCIREAHAGVQLETARRAIELYEELGGFIVAAAGDHAALRGAPSTAAKLRAAQASSGMEQAKKFLEEETE